MAVHVLIITPTTGFGELIRETLRDEGKYLPMLVSTGEGAIACATQTQFDLAIIDADLEDVHPASLARSLRKIIPNLHLIIFPPESGEGRSALVDVLPDAFMDKPFYIPDLVETTARVLGFNLVPSQVSPQPLSSIADENISASVEDTQAPVNSVASVKQAPIISKPQSSQPAPPWLEDVSRAAQYLTRLSLETAAQAALISRSGQLWAYAGQLSQLAANELAIAVNQFWNDESNSDLVRFVRLDATGEELMLYATSLGANLVLALAFEAETPFSKIRAQAGHLARALSTPPVINSESGFEQELILENTFTQNNLVENRQNIIPSTNLPSIISIANSPLPEKIKSDLPLSTKSSDSVSPSNNNLTTSNNNPHPMLDSFLVDLPSPPKRESENPISNPVLNQDDGITDVQSGSNRVSLIPNDSQTFSITDLKLTYTFLMIPRMPGHQLKGDIVDRINEWTAQLCMAFGWRLEHISTQSDYLIWSVSVGPKVSPGSIIKKIRKQLSQRILSEFPRLAKDNPSDDYWASDYMVYNGLQSPLNQVIDIFITHTRIQQGVSR